MYIKNQRFTDEETLMEMLFDFSLGEASHTVSQIMQEIEEILGNNDTYQNYLATLTNAEDRQELETEERLIRLAEALQEKFSQFEIKDQRLFGVADDAYVLLYHIDMV